MSEKRCYNVKELSEILQCSRQAVYDLLKKNYFRSFVVAGRHVISKSSFDEWFDGKLYEEEESQKVVDF